MGNGTVYIRFYANDTLGNLRFQEEIVLKDCTPPDITIESPYLNQIIGTNSPYFELNIEEPNLNTTWYTLNGSLVKYDFTGESGYISQTAWDTLGNGTIYIRFYANDTLGNNASREISVLKDIYPPNINIVTPTLYNLFGNNSPYFELSINDVNLNDTWYTLNGSSVKYDFTGDSGYIDQTGWDILGNGTISIRFCANDSAINFAFKEVIVLKDCEVPQVNIISPFQHQLFGNNSPHFELNFQDPNLNTTWYTLNGSSNEYYFTGESGYINQTGWDALGNGTISIRFYVNDSVSNLAFKEVILLKDCEGPHINILSPHQYQLYGNNSPYFEIIINEVNLNTTWYTLNGSSGKFALINNSGYINQTGWDAIGNGSVTIQFYANDTYSNLALKELFVRKDIYLPEIAIIGPSSSQFFGNETVNFEVSYLSLTLNTTWYTLNDGINYIFEGKMGAINQSAWDSCGNGIVLIKFYANNSAGNVAFKEVLVNKDSISPKIVINNPTHYQIFTATSFNFDISINEANLNSTWYSLNNGLNYTFSGLSGVISQTAWDTCGDGPVEIMFYANDTVGNIGFKEISIYKRISLTGNDSIAYEWYRTWSDGIITWDYAYDVAIDSKNDVYIIGVKNIAGTDEDLVIIKYNSLGEIQWVRTWDGGIRIEGNGICVNIYDEIFITGETTSYVSGYYYRDLFVLKYNTQGSLQWTRIWGGSSYDEDDYGLDIASDSSGNVYVVGGTETYGNGNNDMVIIKYDRNGNLLWMRTYGTAYTDWAISIAIDSSNNIYVTGTIDTPTYDQDMCILKYNTGGTRLWAYTWGLNDDDYGTGVAVDSNGNIYVVGETHNGIDEVFIVKYNSTGQVQWYFINENVASGRGIYFDSHNSFFITGYGYGYDFYVIRYNDNGKRYGNIYWNSPSAGYSNGITVDSNDNVYLAGWISNEFALVKFGSDSDNDNLINWHETSIFFTNPYDPDTDHDGLSDPYELYPKFPLNPTNPNDPDSDDDGLSDGEEYYGIHNTFSNQYTNPNIPDSDNDGLSDYEEVFGTNNNGFDNEPTDPNNDDTDNDGWLDGEEVNDYNTDPNDPDNHPSDGGGGAPVG